MLKKLHKAQRIFKLPIEPKCILTETRGSVEYCIKTMDINMLHFSMMGLEAVVVMARL